MIKLLKYVKWVDVLYVVLLNSLVKLSFLPALKLKSNLTNYSFFELIVATCLILVGGNWAIAFFKRKEKNGLKKQIRIAYILSFFTANVLGFYVKQETGIELHFIFMILFTLFVFFYAKNGYEKSFLNNIIDAFLITFSIILIWGFDPPNNLEIHWKNVPNFDFIIIVTIVLIFLFNLIKNILLDFTTIEEDKKNKLKTLPIVLGERKTKNFILRTALLVLILLLIISFFFEDNLLLSIVLAIVTLPPTLFLYFKLLKTHTKKEYSEVFSIFYSMIVFGVVLIPLISYLLNLGVISLNLFEK